MSISASLLKGVFSLNTAGFDGRDDNQDVRNTRLSSILHRVRCACRDGKVICLQEIHQDWLSAFVQACESEEYHCFYCLSNKRIEVYLLTAAPLSAVVQRHSAIIPDGSDEYALITRVNSLVITNVHFAVREQFRMAHTTALIDTLQKLAGTKIVVGDMNLMGDWGGFEQLRKFQEAGFFDLTYAQHVPDLSRTELKWFHPYPNDPILQKENIKEIIQKSIMLDAAMVYEQGDVWVDVEVKFLPDHVSDHPTIDLTFRRDSLKSMDLINTDLYFGHLQESLKSKIAAQQSIGRIYRDSSK